MSVNNDGQNPQQRPHVEKQAFLKVSLLLRRINRVTSSVRLSSSAY